MCKPRISLCALFAVAGCQGLWCLLAALGADEPKPANNSAALAPETPKPADNSYCLVCHANFKSEKISSIHQQEGIGCAECHGESDEHSADEDGLTPPEIMFAKDQILPACAECHEESKLRELEDHEPVFAADLAKRKVCTDCHGEHIMAVRTRVWDKATGKLLRADGVRMMEKDSPATSAR
jgi:hypothetical protein